MDVEAKKDAGLSEENIFEGCVSGSPDGGRIAFVHAKWISRLTSDTRAEIFVMAPDGSGRKKLATVDGWIRETAWSPDGKRVIFGATTQRGSRLGAALWIADANGSEPRNVFDRNDANGIEDVALLPDGRRALFIFEDNDGDTFRPTLRRRLQILDLRTGKAEALPCADDMYVERAAVSSDGRFVAFVSAGEVYAADVEGPGREKIAVDAVYNSPIAWLPK